MEINNYYIWFKPVKISKYKQYVSFDFTRRPTSIRVIDVDYIILDKNTNCYVVYWLNGMRSYFNASKWIIECSHT